MKIQAIYLIRNKITDKIYIGSAIFLQSRIRQHRHDLNKNKHSNSLLQRAWNKYGAEAFEFKVLQLIEDKNKLLEIEQAWIDWTNCCNKQIGYNLRKEAHSNLGLKWSNNHKLKISISKTGKKQSKENVAIRALSNRNRFFNQIKEPPVIIQS